MTKIYTQNSFEGNLSHISSFFQNFTNNIQLGFLTGGEI